MQYVIELNTDNASKRMLIISPEGVEYCAFDLVSALLRQKELLFKAGHELMIPGLWYRPIYARHFE
jgi:hypothetical protein